MSSEDISNHLRADEDPKGYDQYMAQALVTTANRLVDTVDRIQPPCSRTIETITDVFSLQLLIQENDQLTGNLTTTIGGKQVAYVYNSTRSLWEKNTNTTTSPDTKTPEDMLHHLSSKSDINPSQIIDRLDPTSTDFDTNAKIFDQYKAFLHENFPDESNTLEWFTELGYDIKSPYLPEGLTLSICRITGPQPEYYCEMAPPRNTAGESYTYGFAHRSTSTEDNRSSSYDSPPARHSIDGKVTNSIITYYKNRWVDGICTETSPSHPVRGELSAQFLNAIADILIEPLVINSFETPSPEFTLTDARIEKARSRLEHLVHRLNHSSENLARSLEFTLERSYPGFDHSGVEIRDVLEVNSTAESLEATFTSYQDDRQYSFKLRDGLWYDPNEPDSTTSTDFIIKHVCGTQLPVEIKEIASDEDMVRSMIESIDAKVTDVPGASLTYTNSYEIPIKLAGWSTDAHVIKQFASESDQPSYISLIIDAKLAKYHMRIDQDGTRIYISDHGDDHGREVTQSELAPNIMMIVEEVLTELEKITTEESS